MIRELIDEAVRRGARLERACEVVGISVRTLQRWARPGGEEDGREGPRRAPANRLSEAERKKIVATANAPEHKDLSPKQIVPRLADRGLYLASESTFYRVLRAEDLLAHRDKINRTLQEIIDRQTDPWGIKVTAVEVKDVVLPESMKRAMARQAETERERRAKIINAEGEFQAASKLVEAGSMIAAQPVALQLRFLQTVREISSEHNTHTIVPLPIDLIAPFLKKSETPVAPPR